MRLRKYLFTNRTVMKIKLLCIAAACAAASAASAQLVITEVMANSSQPGGSANGDWWELTNTGASSIDLDGYYWDDSIAGNDGALFPTLSIGAGESIVIVDENSANIAGFISAWGGGFTGISKDEFGGVNDFSGLSSGGDSIYLWDADPSGAANLVAQVTFGATTDGASFAWDTSGDSLGVSVPGTYGAFTAPGDGAGGAGTDIGSPGSAIPEPGFYGAIVGFIALPFAAVRRRR